MRQESESAEQLPEGRWRWRWRVPLWLSTSLVFLIAARFLHRIQFETPHIVGYDGYFHIRYAALLPSIGFTKEFRWAAHSVWATQFADKELLYHIYLIPFTWMGDLVRGMKYATVLLGAVAVTSFFLILRLNRFRFALVWTVLLLSSGRYFLYRLGSPRPHVLSLILLLWIVHCILNRKRVVLAILVFAYCMSYTAFHLALVVAVIVSVQGLLVERRLDWKTPAAVLGATIAGMLFNPYFPNNLKMFWWQNFVVPWIAMEDRSSLHMAMEFDPLTTKEFMLAHLAVVLPFFVALYLAVVRPRELTIRTQSLFAIAGFTVLMSFMMKRFVEYSVPLTLLFLAAFFTDRLADVDLRRAFRGREGVLRVAVAGFAAMVLIQVMGNSYFTTLSDFRVEAPTRREAALYLLEHAEPDELVFTCDWDDVPELFFYNPENRYPVVLDPTFMYLQDRERWKEWSDVAAGRLRESTYDVLARDYRYGACTRNFKRLKKIIKRHPHMEIVFEGDHSYVFRVDREPPEVPPAEPAPD